MTAESGFAASSVALVGGWAFSVGEQQSREQLRGVSRPHVLRIHSAGRHARSNIQTGPTLPILNPAFAATGLLIAEVNINLLCEVGAGRGVSIRSALSHNTHAGAYLALACISMPWLDFACVCLPTASLNCSNT